MVGYFSKVIFDHFSIGVLSLIQNFRCRDEPDFDIYEIKDVIIVKVTQ